MDSNPFMNFFGEGWAQKVKLPGGMRLPVGQEEVPEEDNEPTRQAGVDYARPYIEKDLEMMMQSEEVDDYEADEEGPPVLDARVDPSDLPFPLQSLHLNSLDTVKDKGHLPIMDYKDDILNEMEDNSFLILKGYTGSGKSTQAPQFVLDYCYENRKPCNIIVTQPRRLAAKSLAKRVAIERNWDLGTIVGYQVGLDHKVSPDTRLTYCTTGVLLQKIIQKKTVSMFSHIFLDEVHERDKDMDIVMLMLRRLLHTVSRGVKVVIMSATIDVQQFSEYFAWPRDGQMVPAPVVEITKPTNIACTIHYLENLKDLGAGDMPEMSPDQPRLHKEVVDIAVNLVKVMDIIEMTEERIATNAGDADAAEGLQPRFPRKRGAVLIFLPGLHEIEMMMRALERKEEEELRNRVVMKWWLLPLHSSVTDKEQNEVFRSRPGYRKIILATNIAESSITVTDISIVIDFCLTKNVKTDPETNLSRLCLEWAAKSNCMQRAGRAGRVASGRVYRLLPKKFFLNHLTEYPVCEMLRSPLVDVVLHLKLIQMEEEPEALLALAMDAPDLSQIKTSILILQEAGALTRTMDFTSGRLTFLGYVMANLPLDIHISKLIVLGYLFNLMDDCIKIGAALNLRSPFSTPFRKMMRAYQNKLYWASNSYSDCIAMLLAHLTWERKKAAGHFSTRTGTEETDWCNQVFLQRRVLEEQATLVEELRVKLKKMGLGSYSSINPTMWTDSEKSLLLKIIIAGAFYPHYYLRSNIDEMDAVKALLGKDPRSTILLTGMPSEHPGFLYIPAIKEYFAGCAPSMDVTLNGSRVLVEFPLLNPEELFPDKISPGVYKAMRLRQLQGKLKFPLLSLKEANRQAEDFKMRAEEERRAKEWYCPPQTHIPTITENTFEVEVCHMDNPWQFWVQLRPNLRALKELERLLGKHFHHFEPLKGAPIPGRLYLAPYGREQKNLFRVQVLEVYDEPQLPTAQVCYLDYGTTTTIPVSELVVVPETGPQKLGPHLRWWDKGIPDKYDLKSLLSALRMMPCVAIQCSLAEVAPNPVTSESGKWHQGARDYFSKMTLRKVAFAKVFSVVHNIMIVDLLLPKHENRDPSVYERDCYNIGTELILRGYAVRAEENYLSKANHALRSGDYGRDSNKDSTYNAAQRASVDPYTYFHKDSMGDYDQVIKKIENKREVVLNGPESPLELKLYSPLYMADAMKVSVASDSVNSVLLDSNPSDPHSCLLVACEVNASRDGKNLLLKQTSLLPSIPGLAALVALLFSPVAELRTDEHGTSYTGALCGLGYNKETRKAHFRDHDMVLWFDVIIDQKDIEMINSIRLNMSSVLRMEPDEVGIAVGRDELRVIQLYLKDLLFGNQSHPDPELQFGVLNRPRQSTFVKNSRHPYKWNQNSSRELINSNSEDVNKKLVYPGHSYFELNKPGPEQLKKTQENLKKLHSNSNETHACVNIVCSLCGNWLQRCLDIYLHLETTRHVENEAAFYRDNHIGKEKP